MLLQEQSCEPLFFHPWDKHYGYHGDDGHSFCSSGTGQAYGPTFTTGDVIGCGLNLIDGSCFYTKNGIHLGAAFSGRKKRTLILMYLNCQQLTEFHFSSWLISFFHHLLYN